MICTMVPCTTLQVVSIIVFFLMTGVKKLMMAFAVMLTARDEYRDGFQQKILLVVILVTRGAII